MLNPHTYPLVPYPGLAPELAVRAAMGGWPAYELPIPTDRLLPFVLSRAISDANSAWLNCARVEHADTGALLVELRPIGPAQGLTALDLPLRKYVDTAAGIEHFVYAGGVIQDLALPCGVPLRLVLDEDWQGPRCVASVAPDGVGYLLLEWWNDGPTGGIPYGAGFRQRLYVENAALLHAEPVRDREVSKSLADGTERVDAVLLTRTASVSIGPVPAYLAQALRAAEAVGHFEADGEPWQLTEAKQADAGPDSGRWTITLSLRQRTVLRYQASCPAPVLAETAYDPARDARHPWRCGDLTDTVPEWQTTGRACALDAQGDNTGLVNLTQWDINPQSPSFHTTRTAPFQEGPDLVRCPMPVLYQSTAKVGLVTKNDCPSGQQGSVVFYVVPEGQGVSRISQADADAKANTYFLATRQAYANANGTCTSSTASYEPIYDANGCFTCQMRNRADASDVRTATPGEQTFYYVGNDNFGNECTTC